MVPGTTWNNIAQAMLREVYDVIEDYCMHNELQGVEAAGSNNSH